MKKSNLITAWAVLGVVSPAAVLAQQAQRTPQPTQTPRRATVVVPATEAGADTASSFDVTLTVRGAEAAQYLTVKANNADVREVFREMGQRSGTPVLIAPSASGRVTLNVTQEPLDKAMGAVAAAAGLSVRRIVVPDTQAAKLTPEAAGVLSETLSTLPAQASVSDPATGRMLTVADKAPAAAQSGFTTVYYLQGKMTPEQERIARERKIAEQAVKTAQASAGTAVDPKQTDAVGAAVQTLAKLPIQQRMEAMRNMQRQMWESMSPQEREQMRNSMRGGGRRGQRGGNGQ